MATKIRMVELYEAGKAIKTDDTESRPDLAAVLVDSLEVDIKADRLVIVAGKSGTQRVYHYRGPFLICE